MRWHRVARVAPSSEVGSIWILFGDEIASLLLWRRRTLARVQALAIRVDGRRVRL